MRKAREVGDIQRERIEYGYGPGDSGTQQTSETEYAGLAANPVQRLSLTTYTYNPQSLMATSDAKQFVVGTQTVTSHTAGGYAYSDDGIHVSQTIDDVPVGADDGIPQRRPKPNGLRPSSGGDRRRDGAGHQDLHLRPGRPCRNQSCRPNRVLPDRRPRFDASAVELVRPGYRGADVCRPRDRQSVGLRSFSGGDRTARWQRNFDNQTGLLYLRARYDKASTGRFTQADTFAGSDDRPQSLNRYVYVDGDPVNAKDPSGYTETEDEAANDAVKLRSDPPRRDTLPRIEAPLVEI